MGYLEVQHRRVISARWHQRVTMSGPYLYGTQSNIIELSLAVILCRSMQNYAKGDKRVSASTFLHRQGNSELPTTAATPSGPSMRSQAIKTSNFQELGIPSSQFCQVVILDPNSSLAAIDPTLALAGSHLLHHCQFLLTTSLQSLSRHLKKTCQPLFIWSCRLRVRQCQHGY